MKKKHIAIISLERNYRKTYFILAVFTPVCKYALKNCSQRIFDSSTTNLKKNLGGSIITKKKWFAWC